MNGSWSFCLFTSSSASFGRGEKHLHTYRGENTDTPKRKGPSQQLICFVCVLHVVCWVGFLLLVWVGWVSGVWASCSSYCVLFWKIFNQNLDHKKLKSVGSIGPVAWWWSVHRNSVEWSISMGYSLAANTQLPLASDRLHTDLVTHRYCVCPLSCLHHPLLPSTSLPRSVSILFSLFCVSVSLSVSCP